MRLIDADEILTGIEELKISPWATEPYMFHHELAVKEALEIVRDLCVNQAPTVDAVPVRYGRWIRYDDTQEHTVKYICPYCFDYTAFREDPGDYTVRGNYIYCRKCGARMDGGDEDAER